MATYIVLANFTDQGIRTVKDTPKRARQYALNGSMGQVAKPLIGIYN